MRQTALYGQKFSQLGIGSSSNLLPKPINVPADYPTLIEANKDIGRVYVIAGSPSVTDNDPTKTNTGQTFDQGQEIMWNGIDAYFPLGSDAIFVRSLSGYIVPVTSTDTFGADGSRIEKTYVKDIESTNTPTQGGVKTYNITPNFGTALLSGGEVTINGPDPSKFDLAAGSAVFVDNYTDPENPGIVPISWEDQIGVTVTNIATQITTFISLNVSVQFLQNASAVPVEDLKEFLPLGVLTHPNLTTLDSAEPAPIWGRDVMQTLGNLYGSLGFTINESGNEYTANGANLNIDKSEGIMGANGVNYGTSKKDPNRKTSSQQLALSFYTLYRNTPVPTLAFTDTVPNTQYDPNGDGTLVDIPEGYFATHRIYFDPGSNTTILQYSQFVYDSQKKASTSWEQENFIKDSLIERVSLRTILIIQKDCTALNDADCTKFIHMGILGDRTLNEIQNFSLFAENIEIIDGMSYQQPSITYVNDGGILYADVESVGGGNITYAFEQKEFILDCTTGSGVGGKARTALTAGTATLPTVNYLYVTRVGDVAQLNASTAFPTGQFGWVAEALVPDAATFNSVGVYSTQRFSDNKSHNGRGALSYEREKIRSLGVTYESGIVPTITITQAVPDELDFQTTSGEVYQLHKNTMPALDSAVDGIFIINHPTTPWLHVTSLETIQIDATGATLENRAFNFVFVGIKSTADGVDYSQLGLLLPNSSYLYNSTSQALADGNNTAITSVPSSIKKTAFLIARVTFRYKAGDWENLVADLTSQTFFDLRGLPLGATSGGAGTPSVTEFDDNVFRVFNNADNTKKIAMDASKVATGTAPKIIMANHDVDLDDVTPQWQDAVISFVDFTASEPVLVAGNRYINTGTGLSSITSQSVTADYIYEGNVDATSWDETIAKAGMRVWVNADVDVFLYAGVGWFIDHSATNQLQKICIGKSGNDSNSGLSRDDAVLTIKQAIILGNAQAPSSSNRFKLDIIDGGVYDIGADNLTLSAYLYLVGEGATLNATTGSLNLRDQSMLVIGNITKSDGGYIIQKTVGSGDAYVQVLGDIHTNTYGFINLANGSLHLDVKRAFTLGSTDPSFIQLIGSSKLYITGTYLDNTGASGKTLRAQDTARIYADIDSINATNEWLALEGDAHAYVKAHEVTGATNLSATSTYDLDVGGTRTRSSGINIIAASGDIVETVTSPGKKKINGSLLATGEVKSKGDITGMVVTYGNTITVVIAAGSIEMNGELYILSSNTNYNMSTIASAFGIHYIYVDASASSPPTPTFIDSTTEPTYSTAKRGWYNGDDRCIWAVVSRSGTATVDYFSVAPQSGHFIRVHYGRASLLQLASNMDPVSAWQIPNLNESSVTIPVTATAVKLWLSNTDVDAIVVLTAASSEMAVVNTALADGEIYYTASIELILNDAWVNLGASRNVKIGGANDDDSLLSAWVTGFEIQR